MSRWQMRLWLRLWRWSRGKALASLREEHFEEYRDALRAWNQGAHLTDPLNTPQWITRGLADDLALHDAADYLLESRAEASS